MTELIAAIDQGTTSTRCMLFDHSGRAVAAHQLEHRQHYPQPGWVEHDPVEIWQCTRQAVRYTLAKAPSARIIAVGIANQRETAVVWNRHTGQPYHNAIVWQDTRTDARSAARSPERPARTVSAPGRVCRWPAISRVRKSGGCSTMSMSCVAMPSTATRWPG